MRVDPRITAGPVAAAPRRAAAGTRFSVGTERPAAGGSGAASAASPLASLDALLALQGDAEDPAERRRRSARQGHAMLDALDRLKAALVGGRVPPADLRAVVARLAEGQEASGDPALDEVLAHVRLRAEVELAKLGAGRA